MLRTALLIVALTACAIGLGAWLVGGQNTLPLAFWGGAIAIAVWVERWRYRSRAMSDASDWQRTTERFIDPESGQLMQVLYNPRTGERRYDSAPDAPHNAG